MKTVPVFIFILLLLSGCSPQPDRPAQLENFDLQGHRGAMGMFSENTIPGFLTGIDQGVNTIEFDVVVSGDQQVVVSHEPWFRSDICLDPDGNEIPEEEELDHLIYAMNYEEIRRYNCGSLQHPDHPDQETQSQPKPTLIRAIEVMEDYIENHNLPPVRYSIETKSRPEWDNRKSPDPETFVDLLYDELQQLDILDRVIVQSFDTRTLQHLRQIDESVHQALLISRNGGNVPTDIENLGYTPEIYSPNYHLVTGEMVEEAHQKGMQVIPWTVNHPEDMRSMIERGVDGLLTDYPNKFNREVRDMVN